MSVLGLPAIGVSNDIARLSEFKLGEMAYKGNASSWPLLAAIQMELNIVKVKIRIGEGAVHANRVSMTVISETQKKHASIVSYIKNVSKFM